MHRILLRQMQQASIEFPASSKEWQKLLGLVSATYEDFDKDRVLIERSLEISSKELRLAVATMKTTLDSVEEGVLVIDGNHKITYHNKSFVEIWEISSKEIAPQLTQQVIATMVEKTIDSKSLQQIIDAANHGKELGEDLTIKLNNQKVVSVKAYPQLLGAETVGRVWSFRDITKYVSFQEQIQDKVATLERLNKTMVDRELKMIELKNKVEALGLVR